MAATSRTFTVVTEQTQSTASSSRKFQAVDACAALEAVERDRLPGPENTAQYVRSYWVVEGAFVL